LILREIVIRAGLGGGIDRSCVLLLRMKALPTLPHEFASWKFYTFLPSALIHVRMAVPSVLYDPDFSFPCPISSGVASLEIPFESYFSYRAFNFFDADFSVLFPF